MMWLLLKLTLAGLVGGGAILWTGMYWQGTVAILLGRVNAFLWVREIRNEMD